MKKRQEDFRQKSCPGGNQAPGRRGRGWRGFAVGLLVPALLLSPGCGGDKTEQPAYHEVLTLVGTPYERGFQHGQALSGKIASFYTRFLSAGILPWFNREKSSIDEVLTEYQKPIYDNGQFAYQTLLQSGYNLMNDIPEPYIEEMRGVADGSGVEFDKVLILNTFLDTLFGMRALIFVIRNQQDPLLKAVAFETEEGGQWVPAAVLDPWVPSPWASATEIPTDARVRFTLRDPEGIDVNSLRVQLNRQVFFAGDPAFATAEVPDHPELLDVLFTPPAGSLAPATLQSLQIQVGDTEFTDWPPPVHSSVMRDERTAFTTVGFAAEHGIAPEDLHEIRNVGDVDERLQPSSLSFGVRGSATTHGQVLAAHQFTGLDNNTAHKHGLVLIQKPHDGKPFVTLGMAGVIWGSSGMSADGLTYMYNLSDSLDNPVSNEFLEHLLDAKLLSSGIPIGFLMREMMQNTATAEEAREFIRQEEDMTFGWNILLADPRGTLIAVERDDDILNKPDKGFFTYGPVNPAYPLPAAGNLDPWGRPWASVGPDDLRMAMHYQANSEDVWLKLFALPLLYPQRFWTTYYFRSIRTFYLLGDEIEAAYGSLDFEEVQRIMRIPTLNDQRNSMNAAIYAPDELKMWFALGEVPATDAPFREVDLGAAIGK